MNASYPDAGRSGPVQRAPRSSVLVIAPHPDDDAIGCGGTLARLAARGARIGVTYVTDGSASHVNSKRFPPGVLRDVREEEARAALRSLGISREPQFLRAPDSGLTALQGAERQRLVASVAARVVAFGPDIVFAPWLRDPHPDHVVTARIVQEALVLCVRRPAVFWYRVWLPVRGTPTDEPDGLEIDVYDVRLTAADLARKRAAIGEHRSQLGLVVDDDPAGFCITSDLLETWLAPIERFYRGRSVVLGAASRRDRSPAVNSLQAGKSAR
jgi:LmbE family N-acetylglucosaminyl deacetylase